LITAAINAGWNGSSYPYLDAPQLQAANSDQYTSRLAPYYYYSVVATEQLEELQGLRGKRRDRSPQFSNFPLTLLHLGWKSFSIRAVR
jgi:hypothetical protein